MAIIAPVSVTIAERGPMLVLDTRLALAPGGLLLAVRLAREMHVWLPAAFWEYLDFTRRVPRKFAGQFPREVQLWQQAQNTGSLLRLFYWLGSKRGDGHLPDGMDSWLPGRFHWMARGLDPSDGEQTIRTSDEVPLDDPTAKEVAAEAVEYVVRGSREVVAVAGALAAHTPIVLTAPFEPAHRQPKKTAPAGKQPTTPQLCEDVLLRHEASEEVTSRRDIAALMQSFPSGRVEAALAQMRLAKVSIVAVHVAVPFMIESTEAIDRLEGFVPPFGFADDSNRAEVREMALQQWLQAKFFWHRVE